MPAVTKSIHPELQAALDSGRIVAAQIPDSAEGQAEGYAYFHFVGGPWDEAEMRLYLPFEDGLSFCVGDTAWNYVLGAPRDNKTKRPAYWLKDFKMDDPELVTKRLASAIEQTLRKHEVIPNLPLKIRKEMAELVLAHPFLAQWVGDQSGTEYGTGR